ncbi:hypothetical protein L6452_12548 [Arctium lappa]|uniref:Uncharacterized protein n=1 Tax=Arctium lappa TaxID=4217 RepID=A0ACB9DRB7_ARCLA|nr:hypothetical protein L6452_12548 [Arctium lappa]
MCGVGLWLSQRDVRFGMVDTQDGSIGQQFDSVRSSRSWYISMGRLALVSSIKLENDPTEERRQKGLFSAVRQVAAVRPTGVLGSQCRVGLDTVARSDAEI